VSSTSFITLFLLEPALEQDDVGSRTLRVGHPAGLKLTSPGSGEDFDASRCGAGRGAEDTTEAQPAGGLGRGALMGGIGEDSSGGARAGPQLHRSGLRAGGQGAAGRAPGWAPRRRPPLGGAR